MRTRRNLSSLLVLVLLVGCTLSAPKAIDVPSDAILVVVDDPRPARLRQFVDEASYSGPIAYAADPTLSRYSTAIAKDYGSEVLQEWPLQSLGVHCFVIVPANAAVRHRLSSDDRVKWVQNFNTYTMQSLQSAETELASATVARFPIEGSGLGARIALIDTGVDLSHRDLLMSNLKYQNLLTDKENDQAERHGTSVLGILAAVPKDEKAVVQGLVPEARIQHVRGCWESSDGRGMCNTLTLALALEAAIAFEPAVLNLSLSGPVDRVLDALIAKMGDSGTIVVSAHDDHREPATRFPSPANHVVYAAAGTTLGMHAQEDQIFVAPGQAISLSPMNDYQLISGHSVAAPHLTALIARLVMASPGADPEEHIRKLTELVD